MKTTKVFPKYLRTAIIAYYVHRRNQGAEKWDKAADLAAINAAAKRAKLGFTACAGTMWFSTKRKTWKVIDSNAPTGRLEPRETKKKERT